MGLEEFAKNKRRDRCDVCSLPDELKKEVTNGWDEGIRGHLITQYLNSIGHSIRLGSVRNHFETKHD